MPDRQMIQSASSYGVQEEHFRKFLAYTIFVDNVK